MLSRSRPRIERLHQVPLFASCTPGQLARIDSLATELMVGAGFVLQEEHAYASAFIVIVSGDATVTVGRRALGTLRSGQYFGAVGLLDHRRNLMTVTAATSMDVLVFSRGEFRSLLELVPRVATMIMRENARHGRVAPSTPAAERVAPGSPSDAPHPTLTPSRP